MQRPLAHVLSALALLALVGACAGPAVARLPDGPGVGQHGAWEVIGESAEGRPIRARTLGRGTRRVVVIAGIHGDEGEGLRHVDELVDLLAGVDARVRLIEDVNPDGSAHKTRQTTTGVDPNRNWPASNFTPAGGRGPRPLSEPGVAAAHADLVRFAPELVFVLHSSGRGPFINFDGPAEGLAQVFARSARAPWRVVADMGYATPGSFGTWMGRDRGVPTLTVELKRGSPASESGPALQRALPAVIDAFVNGQATAPRSVVR